MIEDYNDVHRDKCAKAFMALKNCVVVASVSTFCYLGRAGVGVVVVAVLVGCGLFGRDS